METDRSPSRAGRRCGLDQGLALAACLALTVGTTGSIACRDPIAPSAPAPIAPESPAERDARMAWWRETRFGLFIHWGLYAGPAGEWRGQRSTAYGEWIMAWANIPRAEYESLAQGFLPERFDAAEWVGIAKDAGVGYVVMTAKHHDGFAMYDSAVSDYDIVERTPWRSDPMRALADEARRQGLVFGVYYSIMDWHHPSQLVDEPGQDPTAGAGTTVMRSGQKGAYLAYLRAQLGELISQYHPGVLWLDGEWVDWWTEADGQDLYADLRALDPSLIVNNRVAKRRDGGPGDFGTPEQQIPAAGLPGVDWETCMTMNDTWGYKSYDTNWKSPETLVRNLVDAASKGGNYLLNVGPDAAGAIPPPSADRLRAVGDWLGTNGEAIHGTAASPFAEPLPFGRATTKGNTLYLHVFDWPTDGRLRLPALPRRVTTARLLAAPSTEVGVLASKDGTTLTVPATAPDPIASVLVLTLE